MADVSSADRLELPTTTSQGWYLSKGQVVRVGLGNRHVQALEALHDLGEDARGVFDGIGILRERHLSVMMKGGDVTAKLTRGSTEVKIASSHSNLDFT